MKNLFAWLNFKTPVFKTLVPGLITQEFRHCVQQIARGQEKMVSEEFVRKTHYQHLQSVRADEYRKTTEYKFLSEYYNVVPDLALRSEYRTKILSLGEVNS